MTDYGENLRIGTDVQRRFEFYFVALAFTITGLSIQTARFRGNAIADALELIGWFALLGSGILGLHRLENMPWIYKLFYHKAREETRVEEFQKARAQGIVTGYALDPGRDMPIAEMLANAEKSVATVEDVLKPATATMSKKYKWQRGLFLCGIACLVVARAWAPAVGIAFEIARLAR